MTPEQLAEARRICDAATPGPWMHGCDSNGRPIVFYRASGYEAPETIDETMQQGAANLSFVEHARTGYPAALDAYEAKAAEVERLQRENAELRHRIDTLEPG